MNAFKNWIRTLCVVVLVKDKVAFIKRKVLSAKNRNIVNSSLDQKFIMYIVHKSYKYNTYMQV